MKRFADLSLAQKILEGLSLAVLAGMFLGPLLFWGWIPDRIPGHYNAAGEITRWGSKGELFLLPVVSVFMYAFMTFCIALIHKPIRTGELPASAYCWLGGAKLVVLADFALIEWTMAAASPPAAGSLSGSWAMLGVLLVGFLIDTVRFAVGRAER